MAAIKRASLSLCQRAGAKVPELALNFLSTIGVTKRAERLISSRAAWIGWGQRKEDAC